MRHEQLLEYAQSALTTLEQGNVKGASNDLRNLLAGLIQAKAALEAEPLEAPLAVGFTRPDIAARLSKNFSVNIYRDPGGTATQPVTITERKP